MSRAALLIFKFWPLVALIGFAGCQTVAPVSSSFEELNIRESKAGWVKLYQQPYESVWRAAQITIKYPVAVNNIDTGVLETDWIRAEEGFQTPGSEARNAGVRYKLLLTMVKGQANGRHLARVTIKKTIEKRRDFFSDGEGLVSDGFEEANLLYRIDRELVIEEAIKKANAAK